MRHQVLILYYTGTFHTAHLVKKVQTRLEENLCKITLYSIDIDSKPLDLTPYDYIILSYPIYAFNVPKIFRRYIKSLSSLKGKIFYVLKQSGEPLKLNNASSYSLIHFLKKRGAITKNEYHFLYPYNIHFRYPDELTKELLLLNDKLLEIFLYEFKNDIIHPFHKNYLYGLNSLLFRLQEFGACLNSFLYKIDEKKCIKCYKCLNSCPTHNIILKDEHLKFEHRCLMCMRCSFFCPKDAIKIGFLKNWKVNGAYELDAIKENKNINGNFLATHQKGFYCFFKNWVKDVNQLYDKYFNAS